MTRSSYLLVREEAESSSYALFSDTEPTQLLSSLTVPTGADEAAVAVTLKSVAGLKQDVGISTTLRGGSECLGRAASRLAEALGVPIVIIDVAYHAGSVAWSTPGSPGEVTTIPEAALIPADASERRRRCDAVLRLIGDSDRASVADRLGDIADRPLSDRDSAGDRIRAAACIDAIRTLREHLGDAARQTMDEVLIVTGHLASNLDSGLMPLVALSPLVPLGRTTILMDGAGVVPALGTEQLSEETGVDLAGAVAEQLLRPAGDLLLIASRPAEVVGVRVDAEEHELPLDNALEFGVAIEGQVEVEVVTRDERVLATMHGGRAGIAVVQGDPQMYVGSVASAVAPARALPYVAPLEILPPSASALGGLGGRVLLGDEVQGTLYFSAAEPDSRAWAAAHDAGILAVASASPETVLRARAVGIRGVVVGSLSDGEREALSSSIERRVARGVASAPFGLLILGGRRESDVWAGKLGRALEGLHRSDVRLQRHPAGLIASKERGVDVHGGVDTVVIGGPRAGSYGIWRGLADVRSMDPHGAVEIGGDLVALPLGDLQRLVA